MDNLRHTLTGRQSLSFALPDRLPAAGTVMIIGAGALLAGSSGSHAVGGRMVSSLNVRPITQDYAVDRRKRLTIAASKALGDIRLWTGLAWGSIAEMLGVSRKTVHNWSSGEEPTGLNAERLFSLHSKAGALSSKLGTASAGVAISVEYKVDPRAGRSSPRHNPKLAGAILENDRSLVAAPLKVLGTRSRRPMVEA